MNRHVSDVERRRWVPLATIAAIFLVAIVAGGWLAAAFAPDGFAAILVSLLAAGVVIALIYPRAIGFELTIGIVVALIVQILSAAVRGWADLTDVMVASAIYTPLFAGIPIAIGLGLGNGLARAAGRRPRHRPVSASENGTMLAVPFFAAFVAFVISLLVVAPNACMTSATGVSSSPSIGQRSGADVERTTCTSPLGITYAGGPGYQAPRLPAFAAGLVVAIAVGATAHEIGIRRSRRPGSHSTTTL